MSASLNLMRPKFRINGFKELERKLARMSRAFSERKNGQTMRDGAEIVLAEMQMLAPVLTGGLRDSLEIVDDGGSVYVGPVKGGSGSRAHFLEFGTVNMPAQPFIRPAFDNTEGQVKTRISSTISTEIDKAKG